MLSNADYKYFNKAKKLADISDYHRVHVGCVAVYQGNVIGSGCNCNKTHPAQKFYNKYRKHTSEPPPKLHAEIRCLNKIKNSGINFQKVRLYIYRARKDQPFGLSRPCPSCMAAIKDFGIKNIYYTTNDGYAHEQIEKYGTGGITSIV